jgi:hypothetical protein
VRRFLGARREPGGAPHVVLATATPDTAVAELVANLALRTGAASAAFLTGTDDHPNVHWPQVPDTPLPASLGAPVLDGTARRGELTVTLPQGAAATAANQQVLEETAACVAVALRGQRLQAQLGATSKDVERLAADLQATHEQLAVVRDAERRRLVAALIAATTEQLTGVRDTVRQLADGDVLALDTLRDRLGELIDSFRTVVRGVHPTVLREHGPLVALEELASDLPRPVRFDGTRFRRSGWEVESGFYHGVAAVLPVLAAAHGRHALRVTLANDAGQLRAVIRDEPAHRTWIARVRDALAVDADRIAALGGALVPEVTAGGIAVTVTMGDRFVQTSPDADQSGPDEPGVAAVDEVWTLLIRLRELAADGVRADQARASAWAAIGERLDEPPCIAVTGPGAAAMLDTLLGAEVRATLPAGLPIWWTAGRVPQVTIWPRDHSRPDRAPLTMARLPVTDAERARVDRLAVQWPSAFLRDLTLVDPASPSPALLTAVDAELHVFAERPDPADVGPAGMRGGEVLVIGVAPSDAAEEVAKRTCDLTVRLDPRLALVAATLRDTEFRALRQPDGGESAALDRFPPAGITVAREALRAGTVDNAADLARLLAERSGLTELTATVFEHLACDGDLVVARRAVHAMAALARRGGPVTLVSELEQIEVTTRTLVEFDLLSELRRGALKLPDADAAARLLGAHGRDARSRLGLPEDADQAEIATAATIAAQTWWRHAAARTAATGERDACLVLGQTAMALSEPGG